MIKYLIDLVKQGKNFKHWGKMVQRAYIRDVLGVVKGLMFLLLGVGLYLWLNTNGLLIFLILMIEYHWHEE